MSIRLQGFWLYGCCFMLILMVWIGGMTRLTTSGLSITEWKPISGAIPPVGGATWDVEFNKYKQTSEYKYVNTGISISEFKRIYLTEYIHRLIGRIAGLFFFIALICLSMSRAVPFYSKVYLVLACVASIAQGGMGWYMVKSGLAALPFVSHYRLTAHLLFALLIFYFLWTALLGARQGKKIGASRVLKTLSFTLPTIIACQIALGGLVAGLKAGLLFNTFPLMDGAIIPHGLFSSKTEFFLNDPTIVQFLHRLLGVVVLIHSTTVSILSFKKQRSSSIILLCLVFFQVFLGILTLLSHVDIVFASAHQVVAFLLFASAVSVNAHYKPQPVVDFYNQPTMNTN